MKNCPFCKEEVNDKATKCKHCHEELGVQGGFKLLMDFTKALFSLVVLLYAAYWICIVFFPAQTFGTIAQHVK